MKRHLALGGAASLAGLTLVALSGLLDRWSREWVVAAMLTIGAALALAAVFYWLNRVLDHHLQAVEQRVGSTEAAVDQVQDDLQQQRRDLDVILRERLNPANHPVAKTIRQARGNPTATGVVEALRTAREDGSLGSTPPMVQLRGAVTFWVRVADNNNQLTLQLGREKRVLGLAPILVEDGHIEDALTELGQQVQSIAGQMAPEPEHIFHDVLDLLELGRTREAKGSVRPGRGLGSSRALCRIC